MKKIKRLRHSIPERTGVKWFRQNFIYDLQVKRLLLLAIGLRNVAATSVSIAKTNTRGEIRETQTYASEIVPCLFHLIILI